MTTGTGPLVLEEFLAREREAVEGALERVLEALLRWLPRDTREPIRQGVMAGGKRLRPILCVAGYRACRGDGDEGELLYELSVALELIHAYSLMHDDLPCMDDAPLRRGRPTPHTLHGEEATALGGALLIPVAAIHLLDAAERLGIPGDRRRELVGILARAAGAGGMVGGQALDLDGEGRSLSREELDGLHRRKTGALLAASLELGATAAGAPPEVREALLGYGRAVGLAFQIADDVLDATASREVLGKAPSDTALEKSTYVALLGVQAARREAEKEVASALRCLEEGGLSAPPLEALARYVVEREF